jgi:hypothetical protein
MFGAKLKKCQIDQHVPVRQIADRYSFNQAKVKLTQG